MPLVQIPIFWRSATGSSRHLGLKGWYLSLCEVTDTTLWYQGDEMPEFILPPPCRGARRILELAWSLSAGSYHGDTFLGGRHDTHLIAHDSPGDVIPNIPRTKMSYSINHPCHHTRSWPMLVEYWFNAGLPSMTVDHAPLNQHSTLDRRT